MNKMFVAIALAGTVLILASLGTALADPNGPKTGDIWICPSVSTNNPNGMWVIGGSGAYYIIKPGTASPNWHDILNPTENLEKYAAHVEDKAQIPAGWGLYNDLPSYPYLDTGDGYAMVLDDGAEFIWEQFGINIPAGTLIHVVPWETASYDASTMTLYANVPLKAATFW